MASRFGSAILTGFLGFGLLAGCSSDSQQQQTSDAAVSRDADFSVCQDTPAVIYMPGMKATSSAGTYVATLQSAITDGTPPLVGPEIGLDTWVVSIANASDGTPAEVTVMAERPWMPFHGHGATTFPVVTAGDPGKFTVSGIDFFMAGYWEQKLDLQPTSGAADKVAFAICVPQ